MTIPKALHNEKFSRHMESIIVLYLTDEEFKTICDDYCTSKLNIEKFSKKSEENIQCKTDYEAVALELEEEILRFITKVE
jgi:hypothetical protein